MKKINILFLFAIVASVFFILPNQSMASSLVVTNVTAKTSYTYPMINFIISARVAPDTEIVFWNSNQPVKSSLWLSKEETVTNSNSTKYTDGEVNENHFVVLRGLQPNTKYYYVVGVGDNTNQAFSMTRSFSME